MVNWWFIAALFVAGLLLAKARHLKHKLFAILAVLLILFFYLTLPKVIGDRNVDLKTFDGIVVTVKLYFAWLNYAFGNVRSLTGNAIQMDWVGNKSEGS